MNKGKTRWTKVNLYRDCGENIITVWRKLVNRFVWVCVCVRACVCVCWCGFTVCVLLHQRPFHDTRDFTLDPPADLFTEVYASVCVCCTVLWCSMVFALKSLSFTSCICYTLCTTNIGCQLPLRQCTNSSGHEHRVGGFTLPSKPYFRT